MYPENNIYPTNQYIPNQQGCYNTRTTYVPPALTKSIYVNKNMMNATSTKVLVNPNFSRQVHINPNFNNNKTSTVFVNPNVFNNVQPKLMQSMQPQIQQFSSTSDQKTVNKTLGKVTNSTNSSHKHSQVNIRHAKSSLIYTTVSQPIVSKYSKINNSNAILSNQISTKANCSINNKLIYTTGNNIIKNPAVINNTIKYICNESSSNAVINTKTKLVRIPQTVNSTKTVSSTLNITKSNPTVNSTSRSASLSLVNRKVFSPRTPRQIISRHKLIRVNSSNNLKTIVKSKYKLIRSCTNNLRPLKLQLKQQLSLVTGSNSRFKLDNRTRRHSYTIIKSPYKLTKKAYMMRLDPQNSIIKNTKFKLIGSTRNRRYSIVQTTNEKTKTIVIKSPRNSSSLVKSRKYAKRNLVKINKKKLKKNNIPCERYNKKGTCKGLANGKCSKKHDPNQIQICIWFLQGICRDEKCTLSHKVSPEKMPTCKFFLEGMCHKDSCPYLHVKLSKDAPVCVDFLNGYCAKALECDKRHQFLCPDFERDGKCRKKLCRYPHGKAVRQYKDTLLRVIARNRKSKVQSKETNSKTKLQENKKILEEKRSNEAESAEIDKKRYYECADIENRQVQPKPEENPNNNEELVSSIFVRPKLGSLPSFISL